MSVANIERFYRMALKDPSIVRDLQNATDAKTFGSTAVELGAAQGCEFTVEEIGEWVRMKSDSNAMESQAILAG